MLRNGKAGCTSPLLCQQEAVVTDVTCENGLGSIDLNVTGGKPNISFQWSTGATTGSFTNVPPPVYWVEYLMQMDILSGLKI